MYFIADKKTYTFVCYTNTTIVVFDCNDDIFYIRELPINFGGIINISFPVKGEYYFNCCFDVLDVSPFKLMGTDIILPPFQHTDYKPIRVVRDYSTDMPACFYPNLYEDFFVVVVGSVFFKSPQPFRLFYLLHEMGHMFYDTEWMCDLFAVKYASILGYNQSNMLYAMSKILNLNSQENIDRLYKISSIINNQKIINNLKQN